MSDLPVPSARRLQKPGWRDARLVAGVVLVLASVVLGSVVVASADDRTPVYAARGPLVPGRPLSADDLVRVDVQLGSRTDRYLGAATGLAPGQFVLREVAEGELVPRVAVGTQEQVGVRPLVLSVDAGSVATLAVGSRVDVYVNPTDPAATGAAKFTGPELALAGVSVAGLPKPSGGLSGGAGGDRPIQVMAPSDKVRELIGQVDAGARVTVVAVPGGSAGDQ